MIPQDIGPEFIYEFFVRNMRDCQSSAPGGTTLIDGRDEAVADE
jgi:hypothetical protein